MLAWVVFFPLIGFLINGLWYGLGQSSESQKKAHATLPGLIASASIGLSFLFSLALFFQLLAMPEETRHFETVLFPWMAVAGLKVDFTLRLDVLSSVFALVITGVGTLIHVYSMGYMHEDETPGKFFAYLNLFCFAMLVLVLGASLPVLFLGWEGVGLCSYLLIGYWYSDPEKASAGKKAFIVNRIGDLGFLLGMFWIFSLFGTLDFVEIRAAVSGLGPEKIAALGGALTGICLLLFVGCTGKSAQIPLFVWLPDAMAGPTPVSALIHAATMVTSGIYLLARLNFLYVLSTDAMQVVAWVGAATALFAATIAMVQTDIKKVLAYSTVSQLGYMFLGCGVGAFTAGVFHVMTHAFFKALLFLGAGSVIHGMHHEQDILKMGGLGSKMPRTFLVFGIGWLAICGIPPFSGFFSKDEILWEAFSSQHGSVGLWAVGAVTAVMTAFYMTRLFVLTFKGNPRSHHAEHAHESPAVMVVPLIVLAVLSLFGGAANLPGVQTLSHWFHQIIAHPEHPHLRTGVEHSAEYVIMGLSVLGAVAGIFGAWTLYAKFERGVRFEKAMGPLHKLLTGKWYIDEIYEGLVVKPIQRLSTFAWKVFDVGIIDKIVLGFGRASQQAGLVARVSQTGSLQVYILVTAVGLLASLAYLVWGGANGIH